MKVLIIEDERPLRDALMDAFTKRGDTAVGVGSMAEARIRLSEVEVEGVVVDLGLPDSKGLHTLTDVIALVGEQVAVVVWTGSEPGGRGLALDAGADEYLEKLGSTPDGVYCSVHDHHRRHVARSRRGAVVAPLATADALEAINAEVSALSTQIGDQRETLREWFGALNWQAQVAFLVLLGVVLLFLLGGPELLTSVAEHIP